MVKSVNEDQFVAETLTGEGGDVVHFLFINVGEQRLWGIIPDNMAALGYKTGSVLCEWNTDYM